MADFIVNKEDEWFNPKVLDIKRPSLYKRYFDESDYEDDFIFLNKLRERLNFLIKKQYVSCANIYSVVNNEIHIDYRYHAELHKKNVNKKIDTFSFEEAEKEEKARVENRLLVQKFIQELNAIQY